MKIQYRLHNTLSICLCFLLATSLPAFSFAQNIGGIGAMLAIDSSDGYRLPFVKSILPNSPAAQSLKENLFIQNVNNVSCKDKAIEDVVALVRGDVGTSVKITVSDDKRGKVTTDVNLVRAAIQLPTPANGATPDPVAMFNAACEKEVRQTRKQGHKIIKTYTSDCGDYFFNFNTDTGMYHVKVLYDVGKRENVQAFGAGATVFDNKNEAGAVTLSKGTKDWGDAGITELDGDIPFKKDGVGTVSIKMPAGDVSKKCLSLYVVVYK